MSVHIKCVIIGQSSVGKSSLISQYVNRRFDINSKASVGSDIATKSVPVGADGVVQLSIFDTAGQERFRSLSQISFRGAECCVIVYDVTQPDTFDAVSEWVSDFSRTVNIEDGERFPFFVVGNKTDLEDERMVPRAEAAKWCSQKGYRHMETSAKLADGVDALFRECAQAAVHRRKQKAFLDEGTVQSGPQRARLVPVGKSSVQQQEEEKSNCAGMGCGGGS